MKLIQLLVICVSVYLISAQVQWEVEQGGKFAEIVPYHCEVQIHHLYGQIARNAGSIISAKYILTEVYSDEIKRYVIGVGSNHRDKLIYYEAERAHIHPNYLSPYTYSMGVLELKDELIFNAFIQPVALIPRGVYGPLLNEQGQIASYDQDDTLQPSRFLKITHQRVVYNERDPNENDTIFFGDHVDGRDLFCFPLQSGSGFIVNFLGVDTIMAVNRVSYFCSYNYLSQYFRISPMREWIYEQFGL